MEVFEWIGRLVWFFLPAGLANMSPVLIAKHWQWLAQPIDGGHQLFGQPIFGSNKTWRGLLVGTLFGGALFSIQKLLAIIFPKFLELGVYDYRLFPWWFGFAFGAAALLSDLIKSFFKRRFRIAPGALWFPFDQVDYLIGPTLLIHWFYPVNALTWLIVLSLGIILHVVVNRLGYRWHFKATPW
ncbi:MAG: CDP-archaeol synthase [Candidatus Kerfeldbacteria bacterium]|nr:CDP-archaeol synthase [Candidatus Kerfeldbacteria bacterium]